MEFYADILHNYINIDIMSTTDNINDNSNTYITNHIDISKSILYSLSNVYVTILLLDDRDAYP